MHTHPQGLEVDVLNNIPEWHTILPPARRGGYGLYPPAGCNLHRPTTPKRTQVDICLSMIYVLRTLGLTPAFD